MGGVEIKWVAKGLKAEKGFRTVNREMFYKAVLRKAIK